MCNQRERLIGYVYNEGDAAELAEVQRHVETCGECQTEIAALRSVREDLLAWDVPAYESVWRPFAPAPVVTPWWRQVPAWAMAAAATIVMASGFAGGSFAHRFGSEPAQAVMTASSTNAPAASELAAIDRIISQLRDDLVTMNARVEGVANRPAVARAVDRPSEALDETSDVGALRSRIAELQDQNKTFLTMLTQLNGQMDSARKTTEFTQGSLSDKINALHVLVERLLALK